MAGQHRRSFLHHRRHVHELPRADAFPERTAKAVGQGVVEGHGIVDRAHGRVGREVQHRPGEGRGDRQPARVDVVLHVVLRRRDEHDAWADLPDDGADLPRHLRGIDDLDVVDQRGMPLSACQAAGLFCLLAPGRNYGLSWLGRRSAGAVSHVHVVEGPARLPKQEEGSRHHEFDVVGVSPDGENRRLVTHRGLARARFRRAGMAGQHPAGTAKGPIADPGTPGPLSGTSWRPVLINAFPRRTCLSLPGSS